jgi:hypothetical protein
LATQLLKGNFAWINHTYDHLLLNDVSYSTADNQIQRNNAAATRLALSPYSRKNMVTPEISGLANPRFLQAAYDRGVRYLISDTSRPENAHLFPNSGAYNQYQPTILEIPRRPNNLFYNVSRPEEWAAEYNCLYRGFWGRDLTVEEIMDKESELLLQYLLRGEVDPWMFHQANLRAYDGTHTLLGDLLDRALAKYNRLFNLPVRSPTQDNLGKTVANRMQYRNAGVTASINPGVSITLTAQQTAVVPVTGLNTVGAERYGGQSISYITLQAGQSITLPLQ